MEHLKILSLSPKDKRLKVFRDRVLSEDLGVDPRNVHSINKRQQMLSVFSDHADVEDIYKFSDSKWDQVGFDEVLAVESGDQIVSIAGNKRYSGKILRLGMHYYTLKKYRANVRSVLWRDHGFVDFSLRAHNDASSFFISIFAHNKKLKAWAERLKQGNQFAQMGVANKEITNCLRLFNPVGEVIFNGVPQLILHYSPRSQKLPVDFFNEIGASI